MKIRHLTPRPPQYDAVRFTEKSAKDVVAWLGPAFEPRIIFANGRTELWVYDQHVVGGAPSRLLAIEGDLVVRLGLRSATAASPDAILRAYMDVADV